MKYDMLVRKQDSYQLRGKVYPRRHLAPDIVGVAAELRPLVGDLDDALQAELPRHPHLLRRGNHQASLEELQGGANVSFRFSL